MVEVVERESGISGEVVKWVCNLALKREVYLHRHEQTLSLLQSKESTESP
jgi:hypothetical protein